MNELNELELILLNGLIEKYPFFKNHISNLKVKDREISNDGMYVNFEYINPIENNNFDDLNILFSNEENIQIKNLKRGLGYVIDVTCGQIMYIEFVTYDEKWDGVFGDYKIVPKDF